MKKLFIWLLCIECLAVICILQYCAVGTNNKGQNTQQQNVSGVVCDYSTEQPLSMAKVSLLDTEFECTSDSVGMFCLVDVQPGVYTMRAVLFGYRTINHEIEIGQGESLRVVLRMQSLARIEKYKYARIAQQIQGTARR